MVFCFVGCSVFSANDKNDDLKGTPEGDENDDSQGNKGKVVRSLRKAIDSYDDLLRAWSMIKEHLGSKDLLITPYAVKDDPNGKFKVIYHFEEVSRYTYYPIGFDDFFSKQSRGLFYNRIYLLDMSSADCMHLDEKYSNEDFAKYSHKPYLNKEDEDYEKFAEYEKYPVINLIGVFGVPIEDRSLVSLEEVESVYQYRYQYTLYYSGKEKMHIDSCVPIDESMLNLILDNLIILE